MVKIFKDMFICFDRIHVNFVNENENNKHNENAAYFDCWTSHAHFPEQEAQLSQRSRAVLHVIEC